MGRITIIAISAVLAMTIVVFNAPGDQKHQSSSKNDGKVQSGDKHKDKGTGKKPPAQIEAKKGVPVQTVTPQNLGGPIKNTGTKGHTWMPMLKNVGKNANVGPGAQGAINTVVSGDFLSTTQRQNLNDLVAGNPAKLSEDDLKAVQAALDFDALAKREERYLKLENATGERITVWLHYREMVENESFQWLPTKPVDADKALRYVVEPNATPFVTDSNGVRIAAAQARVWAESDNGHKWLAYRDRDLKLKPAEKADVREMGTHTLRLVGSDAKTEQAAK